MYYEYRVALQNTGMAGYAGGEKTLSVHGQGEQAVVAWEVEMGVDSSSHEALFTMTRVL